MKKQNGFTLIELMIVVAVIGVLSAIAIPQYQNFAKKGAIGSGIATLTALKTNIEDYIIQNNSYPSSPSLVGAISSSLGKIDVKSSGALFTFNEGAANGALIKLAREESGKWNCTYGPETAIAEDLNLAGCKYEAKKTDLELP